MKSSDSTSPIGTVIASGADSTYVNTIPTTQSTTGDGSVSLDLGFPPECAISVAAGGKRPEMKDVNGVWKLLSSAIQSLQAYRGVYNADFSTSIGGYPNYAVVSDSSGVLWVSTADSNTTVPGATDADWKLFFDGYATETWANDTFVGRGASVYDYTPLQAGVNKSTGEIWLSYTNSSGEVSYAYAQPAGDYALQTALTAEVTRAEAAEETLNNDKVNRSGDIMTGALTISEHFGSDTSGQLRWGGYLNSTITDATWNSLQLYMCELVEKYAYADLQVNYHDGSGNVARADFLFRSDTGRIHAPAGIMAVESDLPTFPASLATPGYQKLPSGLIIQWGLISFTSQTMTISLPIAFPNNFFIVQATDVGAGGLGYGATPASLSTFTTRTTNSDVVDGTFFAIGN